MSRNPNMPTECLAAYASYACYLSLAVCPECGRRGQEGYQVEVIPWRFGADDRTPIFDRLPYIEDRRRCLHCRAPLGKLPTLAEFARGEV